MASDASSTSNVLPFDDHVHLVKRWLRGDEKAMKALYERHHTPSYRLALALLGDASEAEDIAQQSLIDGLLSPEKYDASRGDFAPWLMAIVVNNCRMSQRRKKRFVQILKQWVARRTTRASSPSTPEEHSTTSDRDRLIRQALDALSPLMREAVVLRLWGGYSYKEIGMIVGCPQRTAQSRVRLAMDELKTLLPAELAHHTRT